jgi:hypothetical protein
VHDHVGGVLERAAPQRGVAKVVSTTTSTPAPARLTAASAAGRGRSRSGFAMVLQDQRPGAGPQAAASQLGRVVADDGGDVRRVPQRAARSAKDAAPVPP